MTQKPRFIFFKMYNCNACDKFADGIWPILVSDQEMMENFKSVLYVFGDAPDGKNYRLHDKYNFVTKVPYFAIEFPNGEILDLGTMGKDRSIQGIKSHISQALSYKNNLEKNPLLGINPQIRKMIPPNSKMVDNIKITENSKVTDNKKSDILI